MCFEQFLAGSHPPGPGTSSPAFFGSCMHLILLFRNMIDVPHWEVNASSLLGECRVLGPAQNQMESHCPGSSEITFNGQICFVDFFAQQESKGYICGDRKIESHVLVLSVPVSHVPALPRSALVPPVSLCFECDPRWLCNHHFPSILFFSTERCGT